MNDPLLFYKIMGYPTPPRKHFFYYGKISDQEKTTNKTNKYLQDKFNKTIKLTLDSEKIPQNSNYTLYNKIKKHQDIFKKIPSINAVYLCDGLSFNIYDTYSDTKNSDIDLFFVCKKGTIWQTRLLTVIIFSILGIKRSLQKKGGYFDLIFYVDEESTDLETISLKPQDIYLTYRLAHLIPIYRKDPNYNIYNNNQRIKNELPYFPMTHIYTLEKDLDIIPKDIKTKTRKKISNTTWEFIIKKLRSPIIQYKKNKSPEKHKHIIVSDNILKFHHDQRENIQSKRNNFQN